MKVHLWRAYNPKKISIDISQELKTQIKKFVEYKIKFISKKIKINPARLYDYFIYQKTPIPLSKLILISKLIKVSLVEIERNIKMYKQMFVPTKNSITNPKLPLEISPYFTSIMQTYILMGVFQKMEKELIIIKKIKK